MVEVSFIRQNSFEMGLDLQFNTMKILLKLLLKN